MRALLCLINDYTFLYKLIPAATVTGLGGVVPFRSACLPRNVTGGWGRGGGTEDFSPLDVFLCMEGEVAGRGGLGLLPVKSIYPRFELTLQLTNRHWQGINA